MKNTIPAFPQTPIGEQTAGVTGGMTLRDYFAEGAMRAMLSAGFSGDNPDPDYLLLEGKTSAQLLSERAYKYADAMLLQREKEV